MPAKKHINLSSFLPFQNSYNVVVQLCTSLRAVESMGHVTEGRIKSPSNSSHTKKRRGAFDPLTHGYGNFDFNTHISSNAPVPLFCEHLLVASV
jgi:hypothetical protein